MHIVSTFKQPLQEMISDVVRDDHRIKIAVRPEESSTLSQLSVTCFYQLVDIVEWLLDEGSNPNDATSEGYRLEFSRNDWGFEYNTTTTQI